MSGTNKDPYTDPQHCTLKQIIASEEKGEYMTRQILIRSPNANAADTVTPFVALSK